MTPEQRSQYVEKLEATRIDLQRQIAQLTEMTRPVAPDNAIGRVSRMDAINNRSIQVAGLRAAQNKLARIERRLERSTDSSLDSCSECGQPIRFERLMFMPESSRCMRCARRG